MSNNSLPYIPSGIDLRNVDSESKSIVPSIQEKITKYLKNSNGYDPDNRIPKLKLTVIRSYLTNLVRLLRDKSTNVSKINQLNFILHSPIINDAVCDFPERLYKVLWFLHSLCESDETICYYVRLWDESVVYF